MNQIPNIEETHNTREVEEWEREFVEHGASLEHERWANWQNYLHSKLTFNGKDWVLPNELYERWQRQIDTPYADLSEAEKESDRKEARTYLPLVHQQLQKARYCGKEFADGSICRVKLDCHLHDWRQREEIQKAREGLKARIELLLENNTARDNMDFSHGYRNALLDIESYLSELDQDNK